MITRELTQKDFDANQKIIRPVLDYGEIVYDETYEENFNYRLTIAIYKQVKYYITRVNGKCMHVTMSYEGG